MRDAYLDPKADGTASKLKSQRVNLRLPPLYTQSALHPFSSGLPSKLPSGLTATPATPDFPQDVDPETVTPEQLGDTIITDWLRAHAVNKIVRYRMPSDKYTYPATTATEVGWPWGRAGDKTMPYQSTNAISTSKAQAGNTNSRPGSASSRFVPRNGGGAIVGRGITVTNALEVKGVESCKRGSASDFSGSSSMMKKGSVPYYTLEKFGKHAKGREDILKWWGGGRESLP
ncbi:hypothetical protein HK102_000406 [Quaeritorhiza haematococci]|nr:hypothetical protein HK102_000406 [Quaeritorhiza haematococci]